MCGTQVTAFAAACCYNSDIGSEVISGVGYVEQSLVRAFVSAGRRVLFAYCRRTPAGQTVDLPGVGGGAVYFSASPSYALDNLVILRREPNITARSTPRPRGRHTRRFTDAGATIAQQPRIV